MVTIKKPADRRLWIALSSYLFLFVESTVRPELYKNNSDKVYEMVNQIRQETGVDMTANALVNLIIENCGGIEVVQVVRIKYNVEPPNVPGGKKQKPVKLDSVNKTNWVTEF